MAHWQKYSRPTQKTQVPSLALKHPGEQVNSKPPPKFLPGNFHGQRSRGATVVHGVSKHRARSRN